MKRLTYCLLLIFLTGCDVLNALGDQHMLDTSLRRYSVKVVDYSGIIESVERRIFTLSEQFKLAGVGIPVVSTYQSGASGLDPLTDVELSQAVVKSFYVSLNFLDGSNYLLLGWNEADMAVPNGLLYGIGYIKDNNGFMTSLAPGMRYHWINYIITVNSPIDVQVSIDTATSVTMSQHNNAQQ